MLQNKLTSSPTLHRPLLVENGFQRLINHVTDFNARNKCLRQNYSNRAIGIINFEKPFLNFIVDTMN